MDRASFASRGALPALLLTGAGGAAGVLGYVLVMVLPAAAGLPAAVLGGVGIGALACAFLRCPASASERGKARLEERRRLAREIHDGPTQVVADLVIRAGAARTLLAAGRATEAAAELESLEEAARDAVRDLRRAIAGLRAEGTVGTPLGKALASQVSQFARRHGLDCEIRIDWMPAEPLPTTATHELLRITQEALTNVRRHAPGARVTVRLEATSEMALLSIEDTGPGGADRPANARFGLQGMRERAERIGGRLLLESGPGGTRVQVLLPLQRIHEHERSSTARR